MQYIDIGINLMHRSFENDREQIIKRAEEAGVSPLVITGTSIGASVRALDYVDKHEQGRLYCTAGIHPHDAKTCNGGTIAELRALAQDKRVLAIGECGLDYNRDFSPRPVQREWFEKQVELSRELGLPLFLHERDAFDDFAAVLEKHRSGITGMVVHCFTGGGKELERYLGLGAYIGITGWICDERRGAHLIPLLKNIPADRLLLETDAPFLLPRTVKREDLPGGQDGAQFRGGRNESCLLPHIARFIAERLGKDGETLARETFENTRRIFPRIAG